MTTAKDTLQELSSDPVAQRLASERETAVLMHWHMINSSLEHGRAEVANGLLDAVETICDLLCVKLDATREQRFDLLNCDELTRLIQQLKTERRWPDEF